MVKVKVKDNDNLDIGTIIRNKRFGKRKLSLLEEDHAIQMKNELLDVGNVSVVE